MFIASTAMVEGPGNPLVDAAMQIGEDPDQQDRPGQGQQQKAQPQNGSFERFMGSFGSPQRWGGR